MGFDRHFHREMIYEPPIGKPDAESASNVLLKEIPLTTPLTLDQLMPGKRARVKRVGGTGPVRRRLMDMGLISGVEILMVRTAPMGDPVEYKLRGYHLSLRKTEARLIEIEES